MKAGEREGEQHEKSEERGGRGKERDSNEKVREEQAARSEAKWLAYLKRRHKL